MKYLIKFRRNKHEEYWQYKETDTLYWFQDLIEKMFKHTDLDNLEIVINIKRVSNP